MSGKTLHWALVDREALAEHLHPRQIKDSLATPALSLYHCKESGPGGRDSIAVSLPDGQCLLITLPEPAAGHPERRKRSGAARAANGKDTQPPKSG